MITNFKLTHYSELKLVHLKLKTPHFKKKNRYFCLKERETHFNITNSDIPLFIVNITINIASPH